MGADEKPELPVPQMLHDLILLTLLPVTLGMMIRRLKPELARKAEEPIRKIVLYLLFLVAWPRRAFKLERHHYRDIQCWISGCYNEPVNHGAGVRTGETVRTTGSPGRDHYLRSGCPESCLGVRHRVQYLADARSRSHCSGLRGGHAGNGIALREACPKTDRVGVSGAAPLTNLTLIRRGLVISPLRGQSVARSRMRAAFLFAVEQTHGRDDHSLGRRPDHGFRFDPEERRVVRGRCCQIFLGCTADSEIHTFDARFGRDEIGEVFCAHAFGWHVDEAIFAEMIRKCRPDNFDRRGVIDRGRCCFCPGADDFGHEVGGHTHRLGDAGCDAVDTVE